MSTQVYDRQQAERPPQAQQSPGSEARMLPQPIVIRDGYRGAGKLQGAAALITGGDSGIGRATAVHFAREGADVAVVYLNEHDDARKTQAMVEKEGRRCLLLPGDVGSPAFCRQAVQETVSAFGRLDVLVNNAGEQHPRGEFEAITPEQLERTFRTNFFGTFHMAQAALEALVKAKGRIINVSSVTAEKGSAHLIDYSATKGAMDAFTRSLSQSLASRGVRVNAVAPGPIWTPLIPATFSEEEVREFGAKTPMGRAGQPAEVAPCCVFLACDDSSYMTGQILRPNGGYFPG